MKNNRKNERLRHLHGLIIRREDGYDYFFDKNGLLIAKPEISILDGKTPEMIFENACNILDVFFNLHLSRKVYKKVFSEIVEGNTTKDLKEKLYLPENRISEHYTGLERFIIRIEKPEMIRYTGNFNSKTFDIVKIDVCLISEWDGDKKEYIRENLDEIKRRVVEKISNSRSFKKYGVPINFLKITSIVYLKNTNVLQFMFELKI